jgi:hypothetical protein
MISEEYLIDKRFVNIFSNIIVVFINHFEAIVGILKA